MSKHPVLIRLSALPSLFLFTALASCGGGGTSSPVDPSQAATITSLVPAGLLASANSQALSIGGTHFSGNMTVVATDKSGNNIPVTSVSVASSTVITANITVTSTPPDNYLNITVIPADDSPPVSSVLGIPGSSKTLANDIQPIFDANGCGSCHDGSTDNGKLDLRNFNATASGGETGLIGIPSYHCSPKFRVLPGDPRRTSSVLIDKIQAHNGSPACSGNSMPPAGSIPLTAMEIQSIIDWVSGGAN